MNTSAVKHGVMFHAFSCDWTSANVRTPDINFALFAKAYIRRFNCVKLIECGKHHQGILIETLGFEVAFFVENLSQRNSDAFGQKLLSRVVCSKVEIVKITTIQYHFLFRNFEYHRIELMAKISKHSLI